MAIANRELDTSEQKKAFSKQVGIATTTGGTYPALIAPFQGELKAAYVAAKSITGAPSVELEVYSFVVGAGYTINSVLSTAKAVVASGTSGPVALVLGTAGSTQVRFNAGDLIVATVTGAGSGYENLEVSMVIQALQDIKSDFGSST